jgi:hypothetical protein
MMQQRMLAQGPLHRTDGILSETGYALAPIKDYDRRRIKAPRHRIKEWDYYLIANDRFALAITVADNGYMGLDSLSLIDFDTLAQRTVSRMSWLPLGKRGLPASSEAGVTRAVGKNYEFTFRVDAGQRQLYGHMYDFGGEKEPLLFDIVLQEPRQNSMVIVTPFAKKPYQFYYNRKINCLPADGRVIYQDREYLFSPAGSFGTLDWGRGVWPYAGAWYWGSASGIVQGRAFGLNIGYGFGDTSRATENMLFYGGIASKLGHVRFDAPRENGRDSYLLPWQVEDDAGRLSLTFTPVLDRAAEINALVLGSVQHQVFGRFSGHALLDDGTRLEVRDLMGFLEKVRNRW